MEGKRNKKGNKVKQFKAVLLANEEFHEMEVINFKTMGCPVIINDLYIWFSLQTVEYFNIIKTEM